MSIRHLIVFTTALLIVLLISAVSSGADARADSTIQPSLIAPSISR